MTNMHHAIYLSCRRSMLVGCLLALGLTAGQVDYERVLWRFGGLETWRVHGDCSYDDATGTLTVPTSDKETVLAITENWLDPQLPGVVTELRLTVELTGKSAQLTPALRDAKGNTVRLPSRRAEPGRQTVSWPIQPGNEPLSLRGLYLSVPGDAQATTLHFVELRVLGHGVATQLVAAALDSGDPLRLMGPEETSALLVLRNDATVPFAGSLKLDFTDFAGNTTSSTEELVIPAQNAVKRQITVPPGLGIQWLKVTLRTADANPMTQQLSLARLAPVGPSEGRAKGFLFGVCTHTHRWSRPHWQIEARAAGLIGAKSVRTNQSWGSLEPTPGTWRWDTQDAILDLYEKQGIETQFLLGFTPRWAAPKDTRNATNWLEWSRATPDQDAWKTYVRTVTEHYAGRVRLWEVWNEPDIGFFRGTCDEYMRLLRSAYPIIKAASPDNLVMTGGFATLLNHPGRKDPDFHKKVIGRCQDSFDIHAMHQHGQFSDFAAMVDNQLRDVRSQLTSPKPLLFNETAMHSTGGNERKQAAILVKKLSFAWSRQAIGYFWYDLRNDGRSPTDAEHNYGMMTIDYYPKAVYPTYNNLVRQLGDATFRAQLKADDGLWALLFDTPYGQCLVAWNEGSDADSWLALQSDATAATQVDIMGNQRELASWQGGFAVPIGATPAYIRLTGAKALPTLAGSLMSASVPAAPVPGKEMTVVVEVTNPLATAHDARVALTLPMELGGATLKAQARVPANSRTTLQLASLLPAKAPHGSAQMRLTYQLDGTDFAGTLAVPVDVAAVVPATRTEAPTFVLDQREQVINLADADPNSAHLMWKGPDDLSAKAWLWRDGDTLALRVQVVDDQQVQNETPSAMWKADCVQVGMAIPGTTGRYELGLGLGEKPMLFTWTTPLGSADPTPKIHLDASRLGTLTTYDARLPLAAFGLDGSRLKAGIRFSFIVNDNDGNFRESWIELSKGIGHDKDPSRFPTLTFE